MRKNNDNTIILEYSGIIIKGVLKARVKSEEDSTESNVGWIRIDDIKMKSNDDLPQSVDMDSWIPLIKEGIEPVVSEYYGMILEIYENYEGYLVFQTDLLIGDISNNDYEDIYGGHHFI